MSNRFQDILAHWQQTKDDCDWVLATIVQTKGSSYRKAGAHMMINSLGQGFGMLSGGCLEADLKRQARKCWATNKPHTVCYDMSDESDISWQLGIGCGGMVKVFIQPVNQANHYHQLLDVYRQLINNHTVNYQLNLHSSDSINQHQIIDNKRQSSLQRSSEQSTFTSCINPKPNVVIFGAGIDTLPLASLAKAMAWNVTLVDERSNYARPSEFKLTNMIINQPYQSLTKHPAIVNANAIVVMHHNIEYDAKAIKLAQYSCADYLGLLGPTHRTQRVFEQSCLENIVLRCPLTNPIGLDLGGDLPETIALSIISQIQAHLSNSSAHTLNASQHEVTHAS